MKKYKLTKGSVSRVRTNKNDIAAMLANGYVLEGEINDKGLIIDPNPGIGEGDPLAHLKKELVSLGVAPSTVERYKSEKTLLEKIEEAKKNTPEFGEEN